MQADMQRHSNHISNQMHSATEGSLNNSIKSDPTADDTAPKFPAYLSAPDDKGLGFLGAELKAKRLALKRFSADEKKKASTAGVTEADINAIEKGQIHLDLGRFREIVRCYYEADLLTVVGDVFAKHQEHFDKKPIGVGDDRQSRLFKRDYRYAIDVFKNKVKNKANKAKQGEPKDTEEHDTPFLFGGDPESLLWAIPLRRLTNQPITIEYLELAHKKEKRKGAKIKWSQHAGVEVIYLIYGELMVHVKHDGPKHGPRPLKQGGVIHFHSHCPHTVENTHKQLSALLMVIRYTDVFNYGASAVNSNVPAHSASSAELSAM